MNIARCRSTWTAASRQLSISDPSVSVEHWLDAAPRKELDDENEALRVRPDAGDTGTLDVARTWCRFRTYPRRSFGRRASPTRVPQDQPRRQTARAHRRRFRAHRVRGDRALPG